MLLLFSNRVAECHLFGKSYSFDLLCVSFVYVPELVYCASSHLGLMAGCEI